MSEFLKRFQDRILSVQQSLSGQSSETIKTRLGIYLHNIKAKLAGYQNPTSARLPRHPFSWIQPSGLNRALSGILILLTAASVTFWIMQIVLIPNPPDSLLSTKGATLLGNLDANSTYGLFGSKPLATENILLRGVVITSKASHGPLNGYAIFEIDGKPTNAIAVGEGLGKGLILQSIGPESATLLYQGQKMDFAISKNKSLSPTAASKR